MLRYCNNCNKDFDFTPQQVSGKSDLICPLCGNVIGKGSRNPAIKLAVDQKEEEIGNIFGKLAHFSYIFYLVIGLIGVAGFFLKLDMLLYIATGVALTAYAIQWITRTVIFTSGIVFIPIGAYIGYNYFGTVNGACLGVHAVFIARHIIRDVLYSLIWKFIRLINKMINK